MDKCYTKVFEHLRNDFKGRLVVRLTSIGHPKCTDPAVTGPADKDYDYGEMTKPFSDWW